MVPDRIAELAKRHNNPVRAQKAVEVLVGAYITLTLTSGVVAAQADGGGGGAFDPIGNFMCGVLEFAAEFFIIMLGIGVLVTGAAFAGSGFAQKLSQMARQGAGGVAMAIFAILALVSVIALGLSEFGGLSLTGVCEGTSIF